MNVLLCQCDLFWADHNKNLESIRKVIDSETKDIDLIILPEMFSTGFCTVPQGVAEPTGGPSLNWMQQVAKEKNAAVVGSVAVQEGDDYYNRMFFVYPDGNYLKYDKHHLFTYGKEHLQYKNGNERVIAEYKGWRFMLQVCYDLRFPVFARNHGDYDMLIYVASWPSVRRYAWDTLLKARAIENLAYVAGVNRVGNDPQCQYSGGTVMLDFMGQIMSEASPNEVSTVYVELDKDALVQFRDKFPALNDRDNFELI